MTKQSEARAQVLDLIDRLGVGEAIPSERRLTVDFGSPSRRAARVRFASSRPPQAPLTGVPVGFSARTT